jgi:hypothetical protein
MKTLTMSMILSVMFLSAGAFAGASTDARHAPAATAAAQQNVTVVGKTSAWPFPGQISVEPCNVRRCIDA